MPWGELAALLTAVCWSFTAIFFSFSSRRMGADVVNRSRLLFAFVYLTITHWLLEGVFFPRDVELFRWGWLAVSSVLGLVLGDAFLFQAYVLIGPRLSMLMMAFVPILSTLLGFVLFGELVTSLELIGVMLAVGGVAWVVTEGRAGASASDKKVYRKGLIFGLLGAAGQVANLITARYALVDGFSSISATLIRIFIALLILWVAAAARRQIGHIFQQWRDRQAFKSLLAGATVGPFLGIWLSMIAVQNARLGIASTLMALPPVLLIPMEYALFGRRVSTRAFAGTVVAMAGVALLFV